MLYQLFPLSARNELTLMFCFSTLLSALDLEAVLGLPNTAEAQPSYTYRREPPLKSTTTISHQKKLKLLLEFTKLLIVVVMLLLLFIYY